MDDFTRISNENFFFSFFDRNADSWFKKSSFWSKKVGGDKHQKTGR